MKILFVSGEVSPFVKVTSNADLIRTLPEVLNENGNYEIRIMMPRYGTISERKNRLHEVIRLSGTAVQVGARADSFAVKVASIPGLRLQVYFMDNNFYFKRKGVFADKEGKIFMDNEERAFYFAQAALATTRNLGWQPDVIHVNGWMSALVPWLVKTRYANDPLFEQSKVVYTPDHMPFEPRFSAEKVAAMQLQDPRFVNLGLNEAAMLYSDAVAYLAEGPEETSETQVILSSEKAEMFDKAHQLYQTVLSLANEVA